MLVEIGTWMPILATTSDADSGLEMSAQRSSRFRHHCGKSQTTRSLFEHSVAIIPTTEHDGARSKRLKGGVQLDLIPLQKGQEGRSSMEYASCSCTPAISSSWLSSLTTGQSVQSCSHLSDEANHLNSGRCKHFSLLPSILSLFDLCLLAGPLVLPS